MEKKNIAKLSVSAVALIAAVLFACGIGRGGTVNYQLPGPYAAEATNDFSTVRVEMTVEGEKITDCAITSSGDSDLLTDDIRAEWAQSIVDNQSYENDVISGATLAFSAASVKEAAADIFTQAGLPLPEPAAAPEPEETAGDTTEAPAEEEGVPADGDFHVETTTDFSTIDVGITVEGGKVTAASVTSAALEGQVDMLTDDIRSAWAEQIVEKQAIDAVSGVTVSSNAVQGSVEQLMAQLGGEQPHDIYATQKTTAFSTIDVEMTVENGAVTAAKVSSAPLEGQVDLLTDDNRSAWAEQIVAKQSVDAVSGVTISSDAAQEAVAELMAQAREDGAIGEADPKVAELEAALAEAEARADEAEAKAAEAEAKVAEAEAKVAALEAAALVEAAPEETPAEAAPAGLVDGTYTTQKTTAFSTIDVEMTVENGAVTAAKVSSAPLEGQVDLLTDDNRSAWGEQIVEKQDVDAISGVTVSSNAVQEAVAELLAEAKGGEAEEAEAEAEAPAEAAGADISAYTRPRPVTGAPAEEAEAPAEAAPAGLIDGTYATRKTTDFSTIDVAITVLDGAITQAVVSSEGDNDLLTDDNRSAWGEQIVEKQDVDAVSGVTVSSNAVQEAVAELLAEAKGGEAEEAEAEAEAPAEAAGADISAYTRPRPVTGAPAEEAEEEAEAEAEAPAEAAGADISAYTRPRPVTGAPAEAAEEDAGAASAAGLTEDQRLASILPHIVTTMGDNRENSYVTSYLEQDPYLTNIYEGYGFAIDYGSARGHEYTLEDLAKTQRPHPKANCITCKTPDLHKMIEEQGVSVYSMPFDEVFPQMTQNISCYTCHGDDMGNGGQLLVTHQYVNEALGENVSTIHPATLSCGQCHIEYYFTPEDSETMMPYHSVEEMTPAAILAYYDELGFADWTQESTGTRMLKAQHPEMETVLQGKHAALLSCADCHMPPETTDEGVAYRSHMLISPLESEALLQTCASCHGETDMVAFVRGIQDRVTARETEVGNSLSTLKDTLAAAVASGEWSEEQLEPVRKLHREAQWYFDFCYVENSEGAHNSELAISCLETSQAKIDEAMALLAPKTT